MSGKGKRRRTSKEEEKSKSVEPKEKCLAMPVRAVDIFRLLAVKKVALNTTFVGRLNKHFDNFLKNVRQTPRLTDPERNDYLGYTEKHEAKDCGTKRLNNLSEQEICSSKKGFMGVRNSLIGDVLDYQVPLAEHRGTGEGRVDLISRKGNTIYVIEAKQWNCKEHPLRAMMEALTFWLEMIDEGDLRDRQLDKDKGEPLPGNAELFVKRYRESHHGNSDFKEHDFQGKARLVPAILLCKESNIYDDLANPEKKPSSSYDELYKKILKYVKVFPYRTRNKNDGPIIIEELEPKDFWKQ